MCLRLQVRAMVFTFVCITPRYFRVPILYTNALEGLTADALPEMVPF